MTRDLHQECDKKRSPPTGAGAGHPLGIIMENNSPSVAGSRAAAAGASSKTGSSGGIQNDLSGINGNQSGVAFWIRNSCSTCSNLLPLLLPTCSPAASADESVALPSNHGFTEHFRLALMLAGVAARTCAIQHDASPRALPAIFTPAAAILSPRGPLTLTPPRNPASHLSPSAANPLPPSLTLQQF